MEIFSHTFVNAHIIGCSPVQKIFMEGSDKNYYYKFDLYTTGGMHSFKSDIFQVITESMIKVDRQRQVSLVEEIKNSNIKVDIWKKAADRYINFIESVNPSNYDKS